ncbi:MAG: hypothetical protein ACXWDI_03580 [Nocardioides sp.]
MAEEFLSWRRPALSALIDPATTKLDGRAAATLPLVLDDGSPANAPVQFVLIGPQDVVRLEREAVVSRRPAPGAANVETTHAPYVELAEADLPWRYSPDPNVDAGVAPWLALLVGEPDEVTVADGTATVAGAVLDDLDLSKSAAWAHVHAVPDHGEIARVLSPRSVNVPGSGIRALHPGRQYVAALVPTWLPGTGPTDPPARAWKPSGNPATRLPCFDTWTFATINEDDDFRIIAQRLEPLTAAEQDALSGAAIGRGSLKPGPAGGDALTLGGAIRTVDAPPDSPLGAATAAATSRLARLQRTPGGRWVLGLPRYDEPWSPQPGDPDPARLRGWRKQLHNDPRHRGVAGLGAWAAIAWQDRIADAAAAQAGALAVAAERIRFLRMGLQSSRSQWHRRVPADPQQALAVIGPMLRRLPAETGTVAETMAGRTAWLTPALFSSAARRALRPRTATVRRTKAGARRIHRLVTVAATSCPPPPRPPAGQRPLADRLTDPDTAQAAANLLRENASDLVARAFAAQDALHGRPPHGLHGLVIDPSIPPLGSVGSDGVVAGPTGTGDGVSDPDRRQLPGMLAEVPEEIVDSLVSAARPVSRCRPLDKPVWKQAAGAITAAVDPTVDRPVVLDVVLDGITGLREPVLAPPDFAPELDIPLWSFLKENAPDWLLPGGGDVPEDRVMALVTNPTFVDAFLVGANHHTLAELRRRNIAVTTGWTPLRRFWQHYDASGPATDIQPLLDILATPPPGAPRWPEGSPLGDDTHQEAGGAQLVILLHTELFRRYPATQVYLAANPGGTGDWSTLPAVDDPTVTRVPPVLSGTLDPELVFFGFPLTAVAATAHWLVLEEPPPGYRFKAPEAGALLLVNGGKYAAATLDRPVRAFFGNLL